MKVVYASTPEQEDKIKELIGRIYTDIFPIYFSDDEIDEFYQMKVLYTTSSSFELFSTLRYAYDVIASLQTVSHILEESEYNPKYDYIFNKNVETLAEYGLFFPFRYENFPFSRNLREENLSIYTKADNHFLV